MFKSRAACTGASGSRCRGGCGSLARRPVGAGVGQGCRLAGWSSAPEAAGGVQAGVWPTLQGAGPRSSGRSLGPRRSPLRFGWSPCPAPPRCPGRSACGPGPTGEAGGPAGEASVLSPQRTCSSPTRTPRPSSCPARASRWTWRRTARTTASTSTCSTCATSCGACGASPAPAGGRPRPPRYRRPVAGLGPRLRGASGRESRAPGLPSRTGARCLSCLSPPGPAPRLPRGAPRGPELPRGCQGPWPGGP